MLGLLGLLLLTGSCLSSPPEVTTSRGVLRGQVLTSRGGRDYFSFTRIPFAKPPIGSRRFMISEPADAWPGIWDSVSPSPICFQPNLLGNDTKFLGQEDCLYLDVSTPKINKGKLPVIFSIYGGGFTVGSPGPAYAGRYFMDEDVVLVTPNYRLGPFGFLSFEDDVVPGNMGLKDQALALEWTKREISSFGGDPDKITVIGESAGGVSTHLICSVPRTTGLVKGCIAQSGVGWAPWAIRERGTARTQAFAFAESLGCSGSEVLSCLQSKPVITAGDIEAFTKFGSGPAPVLEAPSAPGAILTEWPTKSKNYPLIAGVTEDDGMCFTGVIEYIGSDEQKKDFIKSFDSTTIKALHLENIPDVFHKIKNRFFVAGVDPLLAIRHFNTEYYFLYPALKTLEEHSGPKYFYVFNYTGGPQLGGAVPNPKNVPGVSHAAEMPYFFDTPIKYKPTGWPRPADIEMSKTLIRLWVNFARDQKPDTFWSQFQDGNYFRMENSFISLEKFTRYHEILNFWKGLLNH